MSRTWVSFTFSRKYSFPSLQQLYVMDFPLFSFTAPVDFDIDLELHIPASSVPQNFSVVLRNILRNFSFPKIITGSLTLKDLNFTTCKDLILFDFCTPTHLMLFIWCCMTCELCFVLLLNVLKRVLSKLHWRTPVSV